MLMAKTTASIFLSSLRLLLVISIISLRIEIFAVHSRKRQCIVTTIVWYIIKLKTCLITQLSILSYIIIFIGYIKVTFAKFLLDMRNAVVGKIYKNTFSSLYCSNAINY